MWLSSKEVNWYKDGVKRYWKKKKSEDILWLWF
jgi:hypothetical protein